MSEFNTLHAKPTWKYGPENMLDLHSSTYTGVTVLCDSVEVTEDYIARPDLISLAYYGTDEYADIICKYNGISNPFELNAGMDILVPYSSELPQLMNNRPKVSKYAKPDDTAAFTPKTFAKKKTDKRAPNQILEGQKNYYYSEELNMIFY